MKYSLFIGRWQPLHEGHITIIKHELERGIPVAIGIQITDKNEKNPYTFQEREQMIAKAFPDHNIPIIPLPPIGAVCHGRTPGWEIKKIEVPTEISQISGTKIRKGEKK